MSRPTAIAKRRFQFVAGPESHEFYACDHPECQAAIRQLWVMNELFYGIDRWPIESVDADDDYPCNMCREGGD